MSVSAVVEISEVKDESELNEYWEKTGKRIRYGQPAKIPGDDDLWWNYGEEPVMKLRPRKDGDYKESATSLLRDCTVFCVEEGQSLREKGKNVSFMKKTLNEDGTMSYKAMPLRRCKRNGFI